MAAFSRPQEITIPRTPEEGAAWGWEPHETVTIKGVFTVGDMEAAATMSQSKDSKSPSVSVSTAKMLDQMILRWNLTDGNGNVAVKSELSIAQLPMDYATPILEAIDSISSKKAVADPQAFLSSASAPTSAS